MLYIIFPSYTCTKNTSAHAIYFVVETPPRPNRPNDLL